MPPSTLQYGLQGVGLISLLAAGVALKRTAGALISNCDSATSGATMPKDAYSGQVVWVTGASSGIGKEMAIQLGRQGAKVRPSLFVFCLLALLRFFACFLPSSIS
jgi:hypothetical protein